MKYKNKILSLKARINSWSSSNSDYQASHKKPGSLKK